MHNSSKIKSDPCILCGVCVGSVSGMMAVCVCVVGSVWVGVRFMGRCTVCGRVWVCVEEGMYRVCGVCGQGVGGWCGCGGV